MGRCTHQDEGGKQGRHQARSQQAPPGRRSRGPRAAGLGSCRLRWDPGLWDALKPQPGASPFLLQALRPVWGVVSRDRAVVPWGLCAGLWGSQLPHCPGRLPPSLLPGEQAPGKSRLLRPRPRSSVRTPGGAAEAHKQAMPPSTGGGWMGGTAGTPGSARLCGKPSRTPGQRATAPPETTGQAEASLPNQVWEGLGLREAGGTRAATSRSDASGDWPENGEVFKKSVFH